MKILMCSVVAVTLLLAAQPASAIVRERVFLVPDVADVPALKYGISVPDDYKPGQARPLVLALHPGGDRPSFYGSSYLVNFFLEPLQPLGAIIVAPDCPTRTWTDAGSDQSVMALLADVMREYTIDLRRILVVGYSMGGRGAWFMTARHPEFFTGAITIASSPGDESLDATGNVPTFAIHSRNDEVSPFEPDRRAVEALEKLGRPVRFEAVGGRGHFDRASYMDAYSRAVQWIAGLWRNPQTTLAR